MTKLKFQQCHIPSREASMTLHQWPRDDKAHTPHHATSPSPADTHVAADRKNNTRTRGQHTTHASGVSSEQGGRAEEGGEESRGNVGEMVMVVVVQDV